MQRRRYEDRTSRARRRLVTASLPPSAASVTPLVVVLPRAVQLAVRRRGEVPPSAAGPKAVDGAQTLPRTGGERSIAWRSS